MRNKTAILIFANSAEKEIISKSFLAKQLFETLNAQTIKIAKKTGLPYFVYSEHEQVGFSFGERFTNAIQSVYNKGFDQIITIGNDTPHLTTKHLLKTAKKLETSAIVLGPSTDGGFYLMGLKKTLFHKNTFLKLPWQTSSLNRSISKISASKQIKIYYLEVLTDIDTVSDISIVLNNFKAISKTIKSFLIQSLYIKQGISTFQNITFINHILQLFFNKGSPALLHF
ncbi:DUF2064 domain-containing protein [Algibacter pectinivorans]|uniref:DUF2064 domain-containing protein n=1 Tax=Algibacter pectinivorans TaxID=870482 RepID=A0A1I1MF10_9FLAO|nr:DUF2064 domain-containing protein [Algibacter pectinivorans]SFC83775.1 hypothetical protein SAMN04487987_101206 [Algibacter pectinivorans]